MLCDKNQQLLSWDKANECVDSLPKMAMSSTGEADNMLGNQMSEHPRMVREP